MTILYQMITYIIAYMSFGQEEKLLPFLVFFLISLGCLYVMRNILERYPNVFYGISLVQFASLYVLSLPLPVVFFLTVLFYIMYANVKKEDHHYIVASFGFIMLSMLTDAGIFYTVLVLLLLLQATLYLMLSSRTTYERKWRLLALAFMSLCTWTAVNFSDVMQFIMKSVVGQGLLALVTLSGYLVSFIGQFIPLEKLIPQPKEEEVAQEESPSQQEQEPLLERTTEVEYIGTIFTIICIGLIAYFIVKKMKKRKAVMVKEGISTPVTTGKVQFLGGVTLRPPKNPVRNKVFHLEKNMKDSYARRRGETFEQWMNRLKTVEKLPIEPEVIVSIYSRVRYAEETASKEDIEQLDLFYKNIRRMANVPVYNRVRDAEETAKKKEIEQLRASYKMKKGTGKISM
jgi:hypothetical protein